jgi:hypothetical protein
MGFLLDGNEKQWVSAMATILGSRQQEPLYILAQGKTTRVEESSIGDLAGHGREAVLFAVIETLFEAWWKKESMKFFELSMFFVHQSHNRRRCDALKFAAPGPFIGSSQVLCADRADKRQVVESFNSGSSPLSIHEGGFNEGDESRKHAKNDLRHDALFRCSSSQFTWMAHLYRPLLWRSRSSSNMYVFIRVLLLRLMGTVA